MGKCAVGVEVTTMDNDSIIVRASKEVIVTAGVYNSPKLLMLSGIGPKKHLESFGVKVLSDLPAGENLQDLIIAMIAHKMDKSLALPPPPAPSKFPLPVFVGFASINESRTQPDYLTVNVFALHDSEAILTICSRVFSYQDEICQAIFDASHGRNMLLTVLLQSHPKSRGKVLLRSLNSADSPLVYTGAYANKLDLENAAKNVEHFTRIINTTYFQSVDAELVDLKIQQCADLEFRSIEYWKCYTLSMSASSYSQCCTNPIGTVVDSELYVKGVARLRVADASVMPTITSGDIKAAVIAIAERAADIIKTTYGYKQEQNESGSK